MRSVVHRSVSGPRRCLGAAIVVVALTATSGGDAVAGPADPRAQAETEIAELTAALPGFFAVEGGNLTADVPECDRIDAADALAAAAGEVRQAYGGPAGGAFARIVVFDTKKDAKRFFKLVTSDDAEVCTVATNEAGQAPVSGGAEASADLERGSVPGVKKSVTLEGTITIGPLVIAEHQSFARRGKIVVQASTGLLSGMEGAFADAVTGWFRDTVDAL